MKAYLDTCILIYLIEQVAPWYARVTAAAETTPRLQFFVTDLARMECLVKPLRLGNSQVLREFETYFDRTAFLPLTRAVFDRAAELRAHHNLRTPDAIHVAAALTHGCDEFWTNDNRLAGIAPELEVRAFGN